MKQLGLRRFLFLLGLFLIVVGFYLAVREWLIRRPSLAIPSTEVVFQPSSVTYFIDGQAITLMNGNSADNKVSIFGQPVFGDLNNDSRDDAAVLLLEESEGSGSFFYVAAAINLNSGIQGTNAVFLGDRIALQNLEIRGGQIIVNYVDHQEGEPMTTSPSVDVSAYFFIQDGILQKIEPSAKINSYLISDEDASKYCNGAKMDSDGYRQTITTEKPLLLADGNYDLKQIATIVIKAATSGNCQQIASNLGISSDGATVYIAPVEAWAGISITMCSCQPQVEVNLLRLPGIKRVRWLSAVDNFEECSALSGVVMESYPRQCRYGGQNFTENIGNELEASDNIILESPRPNQDIISPLTVKGRARGSWFFEGSFPVFLTDWDGKIIAQGVAQAQGDWMTNDFVPFEVTLSFVADKDAYSNRGSLILKKDNPSGLASLDDALEIPVMIATD